MKKILYIDLDGVMVDLESHAIRRHGPKAVEKLGMLTSVDKELFEEPEPMPGAIEAVKYLFPKFDIYFLTTAPWSNPTSFSSKRRWVQKNLGKYAHKRLIISHRKDLCIGDFLIDDRPNNGASEFRGEWIQFGQPGFEDWTKVINYLENLDI